MKSIFASKTFWVNVLTIAAGYVGNIPSKYGLPAAGIINIVLRFLTNQPVSLTGK